MAGKSWRGTALTRHRVVPRFLKDPLLDAQGPRQVRALHPVPLPDRKLVASGEEKALGKLPPELQSLDLAFPLLDVVPRGLRQYRIDFEINAHVTLAAVDWDDDAPPAHFGDGEAVRVGVGGNFAQLYDLSCVHNKTA